MIDESTGMTPGVRYEIENRERVEPFAGFFLDGNYYLAPEVQTVIGWLEGNRFIYDQLDPVGEPVFKDRVAGTVRDLKLTLNDGMTLDIHPMSGA